MDGRMFVWSLGMESSNHGVPDPNESAHTLPFLCGTNPVKPGSESMRVSFTSMAAFTEAASKYDAGNPPTSRSRS